MPAAHRGFLTRAQSVPIESLYEHACRQKKRLVLSGAPVDRYIGPISRALSIASWLHKTKLSQTRLSRRSRCHGERYHAQIMHFSEVADPMAGNVGMGCWCVLALSCASYVCRPLAGRCRGSASDAAAAAATASGRAAGPALQRVRLSRHRQRRARGVCQGDGLGVLL